ncbi:MAG: heme exporter protein CcmB [Acidimicrobiia bacterium]
MSADGVWRAAALVAGKDLRIELRSRVTTQQVAPFAVLVLILFAFALDPAAGVLERASSGLFWVAVLLCSLLAVQRAFSLEAADGGRDGLRLSGLDPMGVFLGKVGAVGAQLLVLEAVLAVGVVVLYGRQVTGVPLLVATCLTATAGLAAAGSLYGVLAAGLRVRETLLPIMLLPALSPVLIGATESFDAALGGVAAEGWPWCGALAFFAALYLAVGAVAFGPLLEEQ